MPLVAKWAGVTLYINSFDHPPPHVHVFEAEHEAMINIRTLELEEGEIPKKSYRTVKRWMERNRKKLLTRWNLAQRGESFAPIEEPEI